MTTTPFDNSAILREVARLYIRQQRESVALALVHEALAAHAEEGRKEASCGG